MNSLNKDKIGRLLETERKKLEAVSRKLTENAVDNAGHVIDPNTLYHIALRIHNLAYALVKD